MWDGAISMGNTPNPRELWQQAGGDRERYTALMREHGYLVDGPREPLPCGWPSADVRVVERSREELLSDRARLIAASGMSEAMLFERGKAFELYPEHQSIYETVASIDYLLDGPRRADR